MITHGKLGFRSSLRMLATLAVTALLNPALAIAQGTQQSESIASGQGVLSSNLFAFEDQIYFGLDEGSTGSLRRVPMGGGAVETVAANTAIGPVRGAGFVDVVGDEVFFGVGDYDTFRVEKIRKDGTGRSLLATTIGGYMMGVIGTDVYFFSGFCCIKSVSAAGGSSTQVVTGRFWPRAETRDGDSIYFVDYDTRNLYRYSPRQSNTPVLLLAGNGFRSLEGSLLLGPRLAYRTYPGYVLEVPKDGGNARRIDLPYSDARAHGADDNFIYFSRAGVGLFRLSRIEGTVDSIDDSARIEGRLISNANQIFWHDVRLGQNRYSIYRASIADEPRKIKLMYANGVYTSRSVALNDLNLLRATIENSQCCAEISEFYLNYNGFNPTDVIEVFLQLVGSQSRYEATLELFEMWNSATGNKDPLLQTLRFGASQIVRITNQQARYVFEVIEPESDLIVVVGYSQGNLVNNILASNLSASERQKTRFVSIATPADNVAGNSTASAPYTTEFNDLVISGVPLRLRPNVDNGKVYSVSRFLESHSLNTYLAPDAATFLDPIHGIKAHLEEALE